MFLAAIEHVYEGSVKTWKRLLAGNRKGEAGRRLLEYEAVHHGEYGLYRIVFAALGEADDPEIRAALKKMYRQFHEFIRGRLFGGHKARQGEENRAWAMIGLG